MPRGRKGAEKAAAEAKRRQADRAAQSVGLYFRLRDGESAQVRFVEDADHYGWSYVHAVPTGGRWPDGRSKTRDVVCLDQDPETGDPVGNPCPGCDALQAHAGQPGDDYKRHYRGYIRVIWRNGPVFERNDDGRVIKDEGGSLKVIDHKDQVALWTSGQQLFLMLNQKDDHYKGINRRDFLVRREGQKLAKYHIDPLIVDGNLTPMTDFTPDEQKMVENCGINLEELTREPTYEEWRRIVKEAPGGVAAVPGNGSSARNAVSSPPLERVNPFERINNSP